tara:strand:- start:858 stop:1382 length:525 start_codon:yes stop_codon:yes gene_type:complete
MTGVLSAGSTIYSGGSKGTWNSETWDKDGTSTMFAGSGVNILPAEQARYGVKIPELFSQGETGEGYKRRFRIYISVTPLSAGSTAYSGKIWLTQADCFTAQKGAQAQTTSLGWSVANGRYSSCDGGTIDVANGIGGGDLIYVGFEPEVIEGDEVNRDTFYVAYSVDVENGIATK